MILWEGSRKPSNGSRSVSNGLRGSHLYIDGEIIKMCLDYIWFFSIVSILNTRIHGEKLNDTLELSSKRLLNILPSIEALSDESKRVIYRDVKNHIEGPRVRLLGNRKVKLPRVPWTFLRPPKIQRHDVYRSHKRLMNMKLKKNRAISTTPRPEEKNEKYLVSTSFYIRDHAPAKQSENSEESKNETKDEEKSKETEDSDEKDRINFHIHGHAGPDTYVFGYDTGNGNNRQFRYEERHENGTVTGHYGYYDPRGKLHKVHYTSHPSFGYESFSSVHK